MLCATFLDDQVNDLARRVRLLAGYETPALRSATLARLDSLLRGQSVYLPAPEGDPEVAPKLLDRLEHSDADAASYDRLASLVRKYGLSTGTDNPSVRARLALADLAELLRTDYDSALPQLLPARGHAVLVAFWATWCAPCQAELPLLEKLHREGLRIIAVTDEPRETVQSYMSKYSYTFPVALDPDRRAFTRFAVNAMPAARILDAAGRLRIEAGELDEPELRRLLAQAALERAATNAAAQPSSVIAAPR